MDAGAHGCNIGAAGTGRFKNIASHHAPFPCHRSRRCIRPYPLTPRAMFRRYPRLGRQYSMKVLQVTKPTEFEILDIPIPEPGPGQVLLRVEAVTTCPQWDL